VGYQSEGTLGRKIIEGAPTVKLFGEEIQVRAHIENLAGISGHADRDQMLAWLKSMPSVPRQVFVNHGQDTVCDAFAATITETLGLPAEAPYNGAVYDLTTGTRLEKGNTQRITRSRDTAFRVTGVFQRLLDAGRRLMHVIEQNRGGANKDLAKFADQINALSDKWER
jgi:metallo-beta-lactamase family protein